MTTVACAALAFFATMAVRALLDVLEEIRQELRSIAVSLETATGVPVPKQRKRP